MGCFCPTRCLLLILPIRLAEFKIKYGAVFIFRMGSNAYAFRQLLANEYYLFPYKESQTRQLTLSAFAGGVYNKYIETTIFLKTRENRPHARFNDEF